MGRDTARDRVWQVVVENIFLADDDAYGVTTEFVIEEADVSQKTARDALKSMPFLDTRYTPGRGLKQYYLPEEMQ